LLSGLFNKCFDVIHSSIISPFIVYVKWLRANDSK
jgi:hypothetical protein